MCFQIKHAISVKNILWIVNKLYIVGSLCNERSNIDTSRKKVVAYRMATAVLKVIMPIGLSIVPCVKVSLDFN